MKKNLLAHSVMAGVAAFGAALPASADLSYQEKVVITATRTPVALVDSLAPVTTVSREQLDVRQPLDLRDVFRQLPSLNISRNGGPGASTGLYTRGTSNGHTLILVDGQRVSSATLGSTSFQYINPDQIERIEVVRGARSSLYGSDAIGGVIQIFTRDGSESAGTYVTGAIGNDNLHKVALGTSGSNGGLYYGVHGSYLDTDGINNLKADLSRDDDGYRNRSLNASVGYRFANDADVVLRFLESNNRNEYDNAFNPAEKPYSDSRLQNINLKGTLPVTDFWLSQLSLGLAVDDSDNYDGATGLNTGAFRTEREQLFWQNDFTLLDDHIFTLGYDYYEDKVKANSNYVDAAGNTVSSRDNGAVFAQYQGGLSIVDLVLGVREEDNEEFGSHTTANVSIGVSIDEHHKVVASWAEGFKAPTFNDLYWPASPWDAGNPDLEPEESENIELGVRGNYDTWHWAITYFENDVDNLIAWAAGDDFVWRPYNVNEAEIKGGELIVGAVIAGWDVDAAFTYLEPRDANSDRLLVNRSRTNLVLNADRAFGDLRLGFSVKNQGKRYADAANSYSLDRYTTLGVRLGYQISPALETNFRLDNMFDDDYEPSRGYNQEGRTWQLGVTWRM
ncbi:MAG: TonB-dependent receptor [Porticoccaceae bacterium]